ncbi:uncharacterized protein ACLA_017090 [Aspergillus clavatus NRRL 1]|uniref:DUF7702 domain-containing protein n=1 Tax=Aspergillus clavatus (strain ATCC 1007 / CBS 513.65 / DSM 816 / NCTC 3887 / NRRL 1 / QM 1276 / 107) TaxID=344612 RepID=A1CBZ4_ASPCL|nr:uncharacterized protein ACLA_017090 [Aspergillus clavatus NRRL 1]EAW13262.1 conserved hypothetical protein [Aspergillus clavatus NRRL 1]
MPLSYRNAVAVAEIVFYAPVFLIAVYLNLRHGWQRAYGWFFLAIFSLARLIGASLQLATIQDPDNINLYIAAATLTSVGLSPLLLASLGFIARVRSSIHKSQTTQTGIPTKALRLVEILTIVALILSIVGANSLPSGTFASGEPQQVDLPSTMKTSIVLFILSYIAIAGLALYLWVYVRSIQPGETRLLVAVTLSLPFLAVRLLYSALAILGHDPLFGWVGGSVTVWLCMGLVMEAVVVVILARIVSNWNFKFC